MSVRGNRNFGFAALVAISPFVAFVVSLLHPRDRASKNLVWVFIVFYGAVFYIADGSGSDSVRYAGQLRLMNESGFTLEKLFELMYPEGGQGFQDIYQPGITFLVSRVTDQHWLLFASFGVLLGYVYSRNIWFLIDRVGTRPSAVVAFLIVAFSMVVNFATGLNGVRFWTACHVFVFGFLYFTSEKDNKYLIVLLLTPLIHFSFTLPCALLLLFLVVKRFGVSIYAFLLTSFFVSQLDLSLVKLMMQYLPLPFEERAMSYVSKAETGPGYYGSLPGRAWFLVLNGQLTHLFVLLASTFMFWRGVHHVPGVGRDIFLFGMLIYGATNLVSFVPSAGRFFSIGELLILAACVLYLGAEQVKRNDVRMATAMSSLLAINIALGVKTILEFTSVYLLLGNFFMAPFVEPDVGLYAIFTG